MLFNDAESLTIGEVKEQCQMNDKDFAESMKKLCNPKTKIIIKEDAKKPIFNNLKEKLSINSNFENSSLRLNLRPKPTYAQIAEGGISGHSSMSQMEEEVNK